MKRRYWSYCIIGLLLLWGNTCIVRAQNNPYVDDKLFHYGFSLAISYLSYGITDADSLVQIDKHGTVYHARTSTPGFLATAGFVADLRLMRYLNLRCCPTFGFGQQTITYMNYSIPDDEIKGQKNTSNISTIRLLPISLPVYLKWSAEREINYRPYIIAGGGISYNLQKYKRETDVVAPKPFDYFVEVGLGCDFYMRWFKLCPEIKYRVGFNNVLTTLDPTDEQAWSPPGGEPNYFYTNALSKLLNQQITLVFNFE